MNIVEIIKQIRVQEAELACIDKLIEIVKQQKDGTI